MDENNRIKEIKDQFSSLLKTSKINGDFDAELSPQAFGRMAFNHPDVDIKDTKDELIVDIDMPGLNKEDIKVNVQKCWLEIKAMRKHKAETEEECYYRIERNFKGFYRKVDLPQEVIPEQARARYKEGVLGIKLPKTEKESFCKIEEWVEK